MPWVGNVTNFKLMVQVRQTLARSKCPRGCQPRRGRCLVLRRRGGVAAAGDHGAPRGLDPCTLGLARRHRAAHRPLDQAVCSSSPVPGHLLVASCRLRRGNPLPRLDNKIVAIPHRVIHPGGLTGPLAAHCRSGLHLFLRRGKQQKIYFIALDVFLITRSKETCKYLSKNFR